MAPAIQPTGELVYTTSQKAAAINGAWLVAWLLVEGFSGLQEFLQGFSKQPPLPDAMRAKLAQFVEEQKRRRAVKYSTWASRGF